MGRVRLTLVVFAVLASGCATTGSPAIPPGTVDGYARHVDGFDQSLSVRYVTRKQLRYVFDSRDAQGRLAAHREGIARWSGPGDTESDSEPNGDSYDVEDYQAKDAPPCYLAVRVEAESRDRAKMTQSGCFAAEQRVDLDAPPFRRSVPSR